jgi:hypothetical protein
MEQKTNKFAQFKQWILSVVSTRYFFTALAKVKLK